MKAATPTNRPATYGRRELQPVCRQIPAESDTE
jgi:hypothetical protein